MTWEDPPAYEERAGGTGGPQFDDLDFAEGKRRITRITVYEGEVIHGIKAWYWEYQTPGTHGGAGVNRYHFEIPSGFYLYKIECRYAKYPNDQCDMCVISLRFTVRCNDPYSLEVSDWYGDPSPETPEWSQKMFALYDHEIIALHGTTLNNERFGSDILQSLGVWLVPVGRW